jgi:hypothetical protein
MVKRSIAPSDASRVLEELLPGLSDYAKSRFANHRELMRQVWTRTYSDKPLPTSAEVDALPPQLNNDYIVDFAFERKLERSRRAISPSLSLPELYDSLFSDLSLPVTSSSCSAADTATSCRRRSYDSSSWMTRVAG